MSPDDKQVYHERFGVPLLKMLVLHQPSTLERLIINTPERKKQALEKLGIPAGKKIAVFHGNLPHPPNEEAFQLINRYISKRIGSKNILFLLAGSGLKRNKGENVISLGFVESLEDLLLAADVAIMPIRHGGGMRTKAVDYFMAGLPIITTKKGIEGFPLDENVGIIIHNEVNDTFIDSIRELLSDSDRLQEYSRLNHEYARKRLTFKSFKTKLNALLNVFSKIIN
ncbi:MAG: glycosyltransferase family 4 protein [Promethearchaeota archaeon]